MGGYQFYEFRSVDRALTEDERDEIGSIQNILKEYSRLSSLKYKIGVAELLNGSV